MARSGRFWRNVVVIAVAHVALIAGLIRWSLAARASNPESIVWLGAAQDLATGESENAEERSAQRNAHLAQQKPPKDDEAKEEKPVVTTKSEIELSTPKPTPTLAPKPAATSTPKLKPTPKPTPEKTVMTKATRKSSPKPKQSPARSSEESGKNEKILLAKNESQRGNGKPSSTGKVSHVGGGSSASEFGWYGNMLHDRFYSAWIQPTTSVPSGNKISTFVKVRIEKDGRVSKFEIIKPSENVVVNESVAAIAKRVTEVDAPPTGLIKGEHYDVKINFELNTEQGTSN